MIPSINNFDIPQGLVADLNKPAGTADKIAKTDQDTKTAKGENYFSPILPKAKAIPKSPAFFLVYKFAVGFHKTSISYEYSHQANSLNISA